MSATRGFRMVSLSCGCPRDSAEIDLELVAVRGRQKLALSVSGRFGAAVIVGAIVRLGLRGRDLSRVHRQLRGERLGLLAGFLKFPHIAAGGRDEGRIDEQGLGRRLRGLLAELRGNRNESVLRRKDRAPSHKHRIARQIDDRRKPDPGCSGPSTTGIGAAGAGAAGSGSGVNRQAMRPAQTQAISYRRSQPDDAAAAAHVKLKSLPPSGVPSRLEVRLVGAVRPDHSLRCVSTRRLSGLYGLATRGFVLPKPFATKSEASIPSDVR